MVIIDKDEKNHKLRIVLQPNRSISWPLLVRFYLVTCCVSFSIAGVFASLGYWMVIPFSGLEMLVLGAGLYYTSRCVHRQEVVTFDGSKIVLERGCEKVQECYEFDRHWARLRRGEPARWRPTTALLLGSHGKFVEVGSFLREQEKQALAFELNRGILDGGFFQDNIKDNKNSA